VRRPPGRLAHLVDGGRWSEVAALARKGVAAPLTTSAGRLIDAVSALCGVRARVSYEGQAAVELEAVADRAERSSYPLPLTGSEPLLLDARPTMLAVLDDLDAGAPLVSARFHNALAGAAAAACLRIAEGRRLDTAVLSGGVFQNRLLLERTGDMLSAAGLRVLTPARLPPNDGGISYGQAAVAAALAAER
jgi:hydrogenase maturation protein HypF